jgi:hypothetical protein
MDHQQKELQACQKALYDINADITNLSIKIAQDSILRSQMRLNKIKLKQQLQLLVALNATTINTEIHGKSN